MAAKKLDLLHPSCKALVRSWNVNEARELILKTGAWYSINRVDHLGMTLLHYACEGGHLDMVRMLVSEFKANVDYYDKSYRSYYPRQRIKPPLYTALRCGNDEVAKALISEFGCDTSDGSEAMVEAYRHDCVGVVRALVHKHGVGLVSKATYKCFTRDRSYHLSDPRKISTNPLEFAVLSGSEKVMSYLIDEFGCDVNTKDYWHQSLLHIACREGHHHLVKTLVVKYKADVNGLDHKKNTPLIVAALEGKVKVLSLLLNNDFGCDVNVKSDLGQSFLHIACQKGYIDSLKTAIVKYKADVNAQDDSKNTPLHVAALCLREDVVTYMLKNSDCNVDIRGSSGKTVLHVACERGLLNLVHILLEEHKANVNVVDENNDTPLHVVTNMGNEVLIFALIDKFGCDVSARDHLGRTALHLACLAANSSLVSKLAKHISPLVVDDEGNTPLHVSVTVTNPFSHHKDPWMCIESLLQLNAPVMVRNKSGQTPRDMVRWSPSLSKWLEGYLKVNKHKMYAHYDAIQKRAKQKYALAERITRMFVIGNPGAGKSSLVEALKREGILDSFRKVSPSSVPLHTAGIVPTIYISKKYGRVLFYDFAGDAEYYSSHAAILEKIASSRKGDNIFIIVIDLREESTMSILYYWHSFIRYQQFQRNPSLIIVGSHLDLVGVDVVEGRGKEFRAFCDNTGAGMSSYIMLDCCKPKSKQIEDVHALVCSITKDSPRFELSLQASVLLGLLEKDFSNVPACSLQDLLAHIKETGLALPIYLPSLYPVLQELHDLGLLFIVDSSKAGISAPQVVLNISQFTNIVHKSLFSGDANLEHRLKEISGNSFNIGIIPECVLENILPRNITKECLVQLQYCQEINYTDVQVFQSLTPSDSNEKSFLFFPALCSADKRDVAWATPPDLSYGIGWLARCTNPHDYFPSRFLHVLLLRLVFRFTLSVPERTFTDHSHFHHRCIMWKTGVHWLMEEGVECMVELTSANKEVVILTKCENDAVENCTTVFSNIVSCVMEAKAEFCHSVDPQFFLLDSTDEASYLSPDNLYSMDDVEKALLLPEGKKVLVSVTGTNRMKLEKVLSFSKFTHWNSLFPIDFATVLHYLKDIVKELYELGLHLGVYRGVLVALEVDYPTDTSRRRRELVKGWMNSSLDPPCWWQLVQALREVQNGALAKEIETKYSVHVSLQEKLLDRQNHSLRPSTEFLESFASVVGSKWASLAASLSLRESEIEQVKKEGLSHRDCAFKMLKKWILKDDATYGQLFMRLKTISLFQQVF